MKPSATLVTKPKRRVKAQKNTKKFKRFISNREQADLVLRKLKSHYPDAHCALKHKNSFELLVATILSAQCTDIRVNLVTPALFAKFPNAASLAKAKSADVEALIRSTGFFNNKTKNLISCAQTLVTKFGGELPTTLDEMTSLSGVGRKTANVVLGNCFNLATGVVVDTHVGRLSQRLGWSESENPINIEKDLMTLFPQKEWIMLSHYLIDHGRQICTARSPACHRCFLFDQCPKNKV